MGLWSVTGPPHHSVQTGPQTNTLSTPDVADVAKYGIIQFSHQKLVYLLSPPPCHLVFSLLFVTSRQTCSSCRLIICRWHLTFIYLNLCDLSHLFAPVIWIIYFIFIWSLIGRQLIDICVNLSISALYFQMMMMMMMQCFICIEPLSANGWEWTKHPSRDSLSNWTPTFRKDFYKLIFFLGPLHSYGVGSRSTQQPINGLHENKEISQVKQDVNVG